MHKPTVELLIILVIIIFVVVLYRFFFHGTLTVPLENLLKGVARVNGGNFHSRLPVRVKDEIGFLSESFNSMVASIRMKNGQLRRHAENLQAEVDEQTRELKDYLKKVEALKDQQDGDYFLTSLLIKPLGANNSTGGAVKIESFLRQKKEFEFRHWKSDIGGDINISHSIELHGSKFTVFMNADAMGKSMQGAGGALVLGAVFQSLIERTKLAHDTNSQFPERWLKNAFIELQKVFESFNGSMLISCVIGLIDDKSGLMYFINAEHPWVVLLRNKEAVFLESELTFRKLGTISGSEEEQSKWKELRDDTPLFVQTFQLKAKDIVILGSDGRDDLLIGMKETGEKIINEEESLFLKRVEDGEGDPERIFKACVAFGDITDDFSLLKISYKDDDYKNYKPITQRMLDFLGKAKSKITNKEFEPAVQELEKAHLLDTTHLDTLRELVRIHAKLKNYDKVAKYGEDYIFLNPVETEILYITSYAHKILKNLKQAIDFGERVRLREPKYLKNLINLSDIYFLSENYHQAIFIINQVLVIEPKNEKALKVRKAIESKL